MAAPRSGAVAFVGTRQSVLDGSMGWVDRMCQAYAYQRALGHDGVAGDHALYVIDRAHPDTWSSNHISRVRARTPSDIERVLTQVERVFSHCAHRMFICDPTTPPEFVTRLVMDGYTCERPVVQLRLACPVESTRTDLKFEPVGDVASWHRLSVLVRMNYAEGRETLMDVPDKVVDGLIHAYRKKAPSYRFYLVVANGADHGYGASVVCPNRVGMLEDLFIRREYRGRGLGKALIAFLNQQMRQEGVSDTMVGAFLGSRALDLYQRLGFIPTCLTHEYVKLRAD